MKTKEEILKEVEAELIRAEKFPLFNSSHEGYAVILEEVHELWFEVMNNKNQGAEQRQIDEAIQVAAMAIKFVMSKTLLGTH
jgi:hypothetical protein